MGGVPLARILELVKLWPEARHVVFYAFDDKGETQGEGKCGCYCGVPLHLATSRQTLLALEMNGAPLPIAHGAPIRVRIGTERGSKTVKWIKGIEFVKDYRDIGMGQGGWREDQQYYASAASI